MLYALIVLYNKEISQSLTYNCLKNDKNIQIIIFDNSNEKIQERNENYCKNKDVTYHTLNRNVGISKAYNYAIDNLKTDGYIMILDDDTLLNDNYIFEAKKIAEKKSGDINLPIVLSDNRIISPANVQFNCRIKILKNIDELDINKVSAINSGMVINLAVFKKIHYNENLFLDYVDHDFMKQARNNKLEINLMNSKINQNYSRFQKNNIESEINRFKIYLKDFKKYCKDCNNLMFYYFSTFKYRIHECIKYKTLKFLIK